MNERERLRKNSDRKSENKNEREKVVGFMRVL